MIRSSGAIARGVKVKLCIQSLVCLNAEVAKALSAPDLRERLLAQGVEIQTSTPEQLTSLTRSRLAQMAKIIRDAGIVNE